MVGLLFRECWEGTGVKNERFEHQPFFFPKLSIRKGTTIVPSLARSLAILQRGG